MVWCNCPRKIMWPWGDILGGEANLSHGDHSHYVVWHRIYKAVQLTAMCLIKIRPWVRICSLPCCWFHVRTWMVHAPTQCSSQHHSAWYRLGVTAKFCASFSLSGGSKASKINRDQKSLLSSHLISPRATNTSYWERSSECWGFLRFLYFRGDKRDK